MSYRRDPVRAQPRTETLDLPVVYDPLRTDCETLATLKPGSVLVFQGSHRPSRSDGHGGRGAAALPLSGTTTIESSPSRTSPLECTVGVYPMFWCLARMRRSRRSRAKKESAVCPSRRVSLRVLDLLTEGGRYSSAFETALKGSVLLHLL